MLSPADLRKLVGILGRLASPYDGERAAAGLLASRLLRDRGLSWDDLIASSGGAQASAGWTPGGHGPGPAGRDDLGLCLRHLPALSDWEVGFVSDLRARRKPMTPGQAAKLAQIAAELTARGFV